MNRIFIVEDDLKIRCELQALLLRYGYDCTTSDDFEHIADRVVQDKPQLVLLDINLPFYDGYHICREIRKQSNVPIVMVTSRDSEMDELMSMNLGADDFITKPYHTQILLARIASVLKRAYQNDPPQSVCRGDMVLYPTKSVVCFRGKQIELTKNELRILHLLMNNIGEIVPRDDMINDLWQSDEFIDDNTLTVNVNRLRKKLEEIGAAGCLATRRGQGYVLCI